MSEQQWQDLLWEYLTGKLTSAQQEMFELALSQSKQRRRELREWRALQAAVRMDASSRVDHLPPLQLDRFPRLVKPVPSTNGTHANAYVESEGYQMTVRALPVEHDVTIHEVKAIGVRHVSATMVAALFAVFLFSALAIMAGRNDDDLRGGPPSMSGSEDDNSALQEATTTATAMASLSPTPFINAVISSTPRPSQSPMAPVSVVSATPSPTLWPGAASATAVIAGDASRTVSPPRAVVPLASVSPSLIQPIVSFPAELVQQTMLPGGDIANDVVVIPGQSTVAVAAYNGVWLYDVDSIEGSSVRLLPEPEGVVELAVSNDGTRLAALSWSQTLRIWDTDTLREVAVQIDSPLWGDLQFNSDVSALVSANANVIVRLNANSELSTEELDDSLMGYTIRFDPLEPDRLYATGSDEVIIVEAGGSVDGDPLNVNTEGGVHFTLDSKATKLALGGPGIVRVIHLEGGELLHEMPVEGRVFEIIFSPEGDQVLFTIVNQSLSVLWRLDIETGQVMPLLTHDLAFGSVAYGELGNRLYVLTGDGRLLALGLVGDS